MKRIIMLLALCTGLSGFAATAYEAVVNETAANGRSVQDCYVAGLDPEDPKSDLRMSVEMRDGVPYLDWSPNLNLDLGTNSPVRLYRVWGRDSLESGAWERPIKPSHRFFKVEVSLPVEGMPTDKPGRIDEVAGGVQLWENGPYWAECNVGATTPEGYGFYYWWGDTVGYKRNVSNKGWVSVKDGTAFSFSLKKCPTAEKTVSTLQSLGYLDSTGDLVATYDAATAALGTPWRMPTGSEMQSFMSQCTRQWIVTNGVYGWLVTGKRAYASKSIFLPAAGCGNESTLTYAGLQGHYWSSSSNRDDTHYAWNICLKEDGADRNAAFYRYVGKSIRPVRNAD